MSPRFAPLRAHAGAGFLVGATFLGLPLLVAIAAGWFTAAHLGGGLFGDTAPARIPGGLRAISRAWFGGR
jgi:hypothetical protein